MEEDAVPSTSNAPGTPQAITIQTADPGAYTATQGAGRAPAAAAGADTRTRAYHHVVRAILETPWAILPSTFAAIREVISLRLEGVKLSAEEVSDRIASGPGAKEPYEVEAGPRAPSGQGGAVAVLPIYGTIFPRANLFAEISGGTSMERFGAAIDAAANDPQVGSIVLDVNSPGGSVDLLPETAAKIRAARQQKRVVAVANTLAASAAYWLASQADELVVTPSGMVGSIGVVAAHDDSSGFFEQMGVRTSLIAAGKYKTEGNPYEPLSDEGRAAMQAIVDVYYDMFVADVARGRGVGRKAVREGFGEGRVVTASAALEQGMVDSVETFDAALARVMRGKALKPAAAAAVIEDPGEPELARETGAAAPHAGLDQESEYTLALARLRT
jgi:signal peptide peptidase SppA